MRVRAVWLLGAAALVLSGALVGFLAGGAPEGPAQPAGLAAASSASDGAAPADVHSAAGASDGPAPADVDPAAGSEAREVVRATWSDGAGPAHTLRGRVVLEDGAPVTSFLVEVVDTSHDEGGRPTRTLKASGLYEDPGGEFELQGVPEGDWQLGVRADDHLTLSGGGALSMRGDQRVEIVMVRVGRVRGVVLDPAGNPVSGARVLPFPAESTTDEEGRFDLPAAFGGPGFLWARADGFGPSEVVEFDLEPGEGLDLELRLARPARITGEVLDPAGLPEVGVEVDVSQIGNFWSKSRLRGGRTETDALGRFAFEDLPAGTFVVMVEHRDRSVSGQKLRAEQLTLAEGEARHVVLDGRVRDPIRLRVAVTRGGRPVTDCRVYAFPEGPGLLANLHEGRPDEAGHFAVTLDEPGRYLLAVDARGGGRDSLHPARIPREPVVDLEIALPSARLAGIVVSATGDPVQGARVWIDRDGEWNPTAQGQGRSTETGPEGLFRFEGLEAGTWSVGAEGTRGQGGIRLEADGAFEAVRLVREATGTVRGRVLHADGSPAAGVAVYARGADGRWVDTYARVASRVGAGEFVWEHLPAGDYTFLARRGESASPESGAVRVAPGAEASVELRIDAGARLRVSLVDAQGEPVPAIVRVLDSKERSFESLQSPHDFEVFVQTGHRSNGRVVGPLPPGRYTVEARTPDGRAASRKVKLDAGENGELVLRLR